MSGRFSGNAMFDTGLLSIGCVVCAALKPVPKTAAEATSEVLKKSLLCIVCPYHIYKSLNYIFLVLIES
jgi:hypothetical protein